MKKIAIVFLIVGILLSSCATYPSEPDPEFDIQIVSELGSGIADISVEVDWTPGFFLYSEGVGGVNLTIKNNIMKRATAQ